jgi:oligopeptide transport system substrate-binding protein
MIPQRIVFAMQRLLQNPHLWQAVWPLLRWNAYEQPMDFHQPDLQRHSIAPKSGIHSRLLTSVLLSWRAALLALLLGFIGCSGGREDSGKVLRIGNGGEPQDLDPHTVTGIPEVAIISALLEGLVTYHPTDDEIPYPGAAESWSMSEDGLEWDFFLRENGRWSNGDPVTADDFVYAWRRVLTPSLANDYVDWFYMIEGAEAYHRGQGSFAAVGIRAVAERHFQVRLRQPVADFLKILLNHSFLPVHPPTIERFAAQGRRGTQWTQPGNHVGNGAFVLTQWQPNSLIRVEPNPHYWDAPTVQLDAIEFYPIQDENTELRAFTSGQLDITGSVPVNLREHYREQFPQQIRFDPLAAVYFYTFNTRRPPLDDPRVRHALAYAIDREAIVSRLLRGGERAATGYIPDGIGQHRAPATDLYQPDRARALLAEAGFPGGEGFPRLEILFNTSDNHRTIAEAIQGMWRSELGIDIALANKEWKVYLDARQRMHHDIARAGWVGSLYAASFLRIFTSDSPNNDTGWADARYDSLVHGSLAELDVGSRLAMVSEAESILLEAAPVTPIYWYTNVYLIHPRVRNWHPKWIDMRPYKHIRLD